MNMLSDVLFATRMWLKFRTYVPQKVTIGRALQWLGQFNEVERPALRKAADHLKFISEREFIADLVDRNNALLIKLRKAGVPLSHIIYVSIGEAGSSSHSVLNLLRDHARLQGLGCRFADGRSNDALYELTNNLGDGAVIYVDDFAGTGHQFCEEQAQLHSYIVGNFSEYYLVHTVCEEALYKIDSNGVVPWQHSIHTKLERPLHESSTILSSHEREMLTALCQKVGKNKKGCLGYGDIAVSLVFYRNIPTNAPKVFRGDAYQRKYKGLLPRTTDLAKPVIA